MRGLRILWTICMQLAVLGASSSSMNDDPLNPNFNIYYDLSNGKTLQPLNEDEVQGPNLGKGPAQRVSFRSNGCSCQQRTCGCCTGIHIQQLNFNREGCMNFTYDPDEFSLVMNMFMNNNAIYSNVISAKNPPPFCLPFGPPYLPSVEFCARLFDVHTPGQNLQMCLDLETRVQHAPVFVLHFDCMRMGANGLALVKPGEPLPSTVSTVATPAATTPPSSMTSEVGVIDIDIYDEVTEGKVGLNRPGGHLQNARRLKIQEGNLTQN